MTEIVFTIIINAVKTSTINNIKNVVKEISYTLKGTSEKETFELPQSITIPDPDPTGSNTIEFANLTSEIVIKWVEKHDTRLPSIKEHIKYVLSKQILAATLNTSKLPWALEV